jgi:ketosteroid isomerase-like protein
MTDAMDAHTSPKAIWEKAHAYVRVFDLAGFASLFASKAVLEMPFAPQGVPKRLEGRERIQQVLAAAAEKAKAAGRRIIRYENIKMHVTEDPAVIIVEFTLVGQIASTETEYRSSYIQVVTVRDGKIEYFKDYIDPAVFK